MTKISRFHLEQKYLNHLLSEFWEDVASLNNTEAIKIFLKPFFTPTEPVMFAKRLEILKLLRLNYSYDYIKERLKVTPTTVAKMNNLLHLADSEFLEILDKLIKEQKKRKEKNFQEEKDTTQAKGFGRCE